MPIRDQSEHTNTDTLLNNAIDLTDNKVSYITNIRFSITNNDVTLDLFYTSPNPKNPNGVPIAQRLHRIILPPGLAKNIGQLLADSMAGWEEAFGIELPITPADIDEQENRNNEDD